MRILHVIDHMGIGGAQVLLSNLCLGQGQVDGSVTGEVIVLRGIGEYAERLRRAGICVTSLGNSKADVVSIMMQLRQRLTERRHDVVDLHLPSASMMGVFLSPLRSRPPILVNVHALKAQLPPLLFYQYRLMAPWVEKFIVFLPNSQADLRSVGIRDSQISLIPMGLDLADASPAHHLELRRALALQYEFDAHRPLLLSVARLASDRYIHVILEAMKCITVECPRALLLMVGDGEERARLEAIAATKKLHDNIIFAGSRTDGWNLFPACDVYLSMCGGCRIGVAAFEAMACERAVVAHNIDPMNCKALECNEQGVFIAANNAESMANAVLDLLHHREKAAALGKRARANVLEHLSLQAMVRRYNAIYRGRTSVPLG